MIPPFPRRHYSISLGRLLNILTKIEHRCAATITLVDQQEGMMDADLAFLDDLAKRAHQLSLKFLALSPANLSIRKPYLGAL